MEEASRDSADTQPATPARSGFAAFAPLWKHRSIVMLGVIVGAVIAGLMYTRKPAQYQSGAQVLVVKKRSDALPVAGGDPRLSVYEDYVSTHLVLIRSPFVVERAVAKRNLVALKSLQGGDPVGRIQANLGATRDQTTSTGPPSNIILLSFRASESADTQVVLNAIIESYRDFLDETYRNVSDDTLAQITKACEVLKTGIAEKEKAYLAFRKTSPLMLRGVEGVNVHMSRVLDYQKQETGLLLRAGELKEVLKKIEAERAAGRPGVAQSLAITHLDKGEAAASTDTSLEVALHPLLIKEQELLRFYGEDHPDVISVRNQKQMTRDLYSRLDTIAKNPSKDAVGATARLDAHVQTLRLKLALIEVSHTNLSHELAIEVKKARDLEGYELEDRSYQGQIAATNDILKGTLKRLEEINLVRESGGFEAKVIAPPGPGGKVSPVLYQFILMGLVIGFGLGGGFAYLLDLTDKSFHSAEDIRRALGISIVGHIPYRKVGTGMVAVKDASGSQVEIHAGLTTLHEPLSPEAEAYRGIRTALYFSTHGEQHKVLQVTSPNPGDGKTTVITNLAVAIAQSGRRVVLVDADLRRPRVHKAFGVSGRVGLVEVFSGAVELAAAVQPTVVPNLSVLACGRRPPNPAELLTSPQFANLLDDLREAYDYVLVDTPPLLAVSDPCAVAPRMDGLILVIRVSKNGRPGAEQARGLLVGLPVQIIGAVVNGVGREGAMNGYGFGRYEYAQQYAHDYASDPNEAPTAPVADADGPAWSHEPSTNGHR